LSNEKNNTRTVLIVKKVVDVFSGGQPERIKPIEKMITIVIRFCMVFKMFYGSQLPAGWIKKNTCES